jgi:hypothetical protein
MYEKGTNVIINLRVEVCDVDSIESAKAIVMKGLEKWMAEAVNDHESILWNHDIGIEFGECSIDDGQGTVKTED